MITLRRKLAGVKQLLILLSCSIYDCWHFFKNSSLFNETDSEAKLSSRISMATHGIEKGLTMPNMRLGFGKDAIRRLIFLCHKYAENKYDTTNILFTHALSVLNEYKQIHQKENLPIISEIDVFLSNGFAFHQVSQIDGSGKTYFQHNNDSFGLFSRSRHSIRDFSKKSLDINSIYDAISLSMNAPSSCNRQVSRVHIIADDILKAKLLTIQQGNTGFGSLADKILIVTANTESYASGRERNAGFIDGGMFGMNLLYSLHYHHIGACVLNSYLTPKDEKKIKSLINIPTSEVLVMIILIGEIPSKFKIAYSVRQEHSKVTTLH